MTDKSQEKAGSETFFADWMKMTTELWDPMAWMGSAFHKTTGITPDLQKDGKRPRMQESWDTAQKTWKAFSQFMSNSETMETLSKETGMLPEIFFKIAQTGLNNFVDIQKQWLECYGISDWQQKNSRIIGQPAAGKLHHRKVRVWTLNC